MSVDLKDQRDYEIEQTCSIIKVCKEQLAGTAYLRKYFEKLTMLYIKFVNVV